MSQCYMGDYNSNLQPALFSAYLASHELLHHYILNVKYHFKKEQNDAQSGLELFVCHRFQNDHHHSPAQSCSFKYIPKQFEVNYKIW